MVAEYVVCTISLWQGIGEQAVAHADTEKPFDISFGRGRSILPEALKRRQKKNAAGGFQHIASFHNSIARNLRFAEKP